MGRVSTGAAGVRLTAASAEAMDGASRAGAAAGCGFANSAAIGVMRCSAADSLLAGFAAGRSLSTRCSGAADEGAADECVAGEGAATEAGGVAEAATAGLSKFGGAAGTIAPALTVRGEPAS